MHPRSFNNLRTCRDPVSNGCNFSEKPLYYFCGIYNKEKFKERQNEIPPWFHNYFYRMYFLCHSQPKTDGQEALYQLKALQGMLANFKVLSWEKVWLDKKEARLLEYEGEMQGFNLIWLQIYCINNEKFYSVSYVGEKNDYYKHKSEAMKVIETFKFK